MIFARNLVVVLFCGLAAVLAPQMAAAQQCGFNSVNDFVCPEGRLAAPPENSFKPAPPMRRPPLPPLHVPGGPLHIPGGGGGGAPGGTVTTPTALGDCTRAWSPDIGQFCTKDWGKNQPSGPQGPTDRISCGSDGTMVISEHKGYPLSLQNVHAQLPSSFQSANAMRVSMQLYFPPGFDFTAGRLPLGIKVGEGGASGGKLASQQTASTIRLHLRSSGNLGIYSYHLDRTTEIAQTTGQFGTQVTSKQYGQSTSLETPVPTGEWVTVVMEMVLGNKGRRSDSSALYLYNSAGQLIGSTGLGNVTYNPRDWKFTQMFGDTKQSGSKPVSRDQSFFIRDYAGYICR